MASSWLRRASCAFRQRHQRATITWLCPHEAGGHEVWRHFGRRCPAIHRTAKIVAGRLARGQRPVVVVSAMAKVTDQLLAAAKAAGRGDRNGALAISSRLAPPPLRHFGNCCSRPTARANCRTGSSRNSSRIDEILRGLSAVGELTPRTNDMVVSFGERLSSRLVAEAFRDQGIPCGSRRRPDLHRDRRPAWQSDPQHAR